MKIELVSYTVPFFGNKRINPYGKIKVNDDKVVKFEDGEFVYNRQRYRLINEGSLYAPKLIAVKN